ncbi:MAG: hypothetical protein VXZ15_00650, partial [Planctomycetota bacterium]|nr:hypothetical protein [Planctomycetota bacterium]
MLQSFNEFLDPDFAHGVTIQGILISSFFAADSGTTVNNPLWLEARRTHSTVKRWRRDRVRRGAPRFFRLPVSGEVVSGDVFVHPLDIEHVSNGFTARGPTVDNLAKFHEDWSSHFNPPSATASAPVRSSR